MFLPTARFTEVNLQQSIIANRSGTISCSAEGAPTPQIEWKRQDEVELDRARFSAFSNGSLKVNPVHRQDKGKYTCTLKQTKGSNRVTIEKKIIDVSVISE